MAGKTLTETVDDLIRTTTVLTVTLDTLTGQFGRSDELGNQRDERIRQLQQDLAVLRRDLEEVRKSREEWGRRLWALVGPLLGLVAGYLLKR